MGLVLVLMNMKRFPYDKLSQPPRELNVMSLIGQTAYLYPTKRTPTVPSRHTQVRECLLVRL